MCSTHHSSTPSPWAACAQSSRTAEVWNGDIPIMSGVTCEQAREFLQGPTNWAHIQNKPNSTVTKHDDGSWDLRLLRPSGDVFTVYDEVATGTAEAGDPRCVTGGTSKSPAGRWTLPRSTSSSMEPGAAASPSDATSTMHLKVGGCMSCVAGCCVGRCREDYARFTQKGERKHCKAAQGASRASLTA